MTEVFFWVGAIPVILFPVLYTVLARWWRTVEGRQVMTLALALLGLVALGLLRRAFGADYPGKHAVQFVVYVLIAVALWGQVVLLVRVQVVSRWRRLRLHTRKEN